MVFWRNRSEKKADTPIIVEAQKAETAAAAKPAGAEPKEQEPHTNVVTLVTSRLADRLADVTGILDRSEAKEVKDPGAIRPIEQPHLFGQKRAIARIRTALAARAGEHLLIIGEPGTGRLALAQALAAEVDRPSGADWIYVVDHHTPSRAKAFALPPGEGVRFRREIRAAIDKANAAFARHLKSEEHRMSLDLLEEEMRYRGEQAVEPVRRRAEAQNIAVVKSLDGYVLAPMHEGRVVRSDVFRALPETLKRNVEAKIKALESELQSIIATLPDVEFEANEKHEALIRQSALRAIRPGLAGLKLTGAGHSTAVAALDAVEEAFLASATRSTGGAEAFAPVALLDCDEGSRAEAGGWPGVVTALQASPVDLVGEVGRDAMGRPTLVPGHLLRAGSGFLIVEAWRLAADPRAWLALSAAITAHEIAPMMAPGVAIKADPIPLAATIILVADSQSWSKLEAIDPGIARHFPHVAKLADTVPIADLGEDEFAKGAARLAADHGMRPLNPAVAPLIYKDAVRRGGGRVSLAGIALLHLLQEANAIAGGHCVSQIRAVDVTEALARRADGDAP